MKTKQLHIHAILVTLLMLMSGGDGFAQNIIQIQGELSKTEITENATIQLTGDVKLKGSIIIDTGRTLTIENATDSDVTIKAVQTIESSMIGARYNSRLIIKGKPNARIIIDGGADFVWKENNEMPYRELQAKSAIKVREGILNRGYLEMEYVTIQNVNDTNENGGAIWIDTDNGIPNKGTKIDNCIIRHCFSSMGAAIYLQTTCKKGNNGAYITNSTITECISGGNYSSKSDNRGGAIRTLGSNTASLYLTNVTMSNCYAMREYDEYNNTLLHDGNGGAIFWNGRGTSDTKLVLDGCIFENNMCDDNGGAIKAQGSIEFVNNKTVIKNNQAPNGAGLYIEGYTGGISDSSPPTINYDLNQYLEVMNNTSVPYSYNDENISGKGSGVHFYFGEEMTLIDGSTINVNLNGATIQNNTIKGYGGLGAGIYYEDTSFEDKNYTFNIYLNHGTLKNNTGAAYGGGMYISDGTILSNASSNKMVIDGNKASVSGGGLYIGSGSYTMQTGEIMNNQALTEDGGGVYVGGDLILQKGTIANNKALNGNGGGAYIKNGDFSISQKGEISNNQAGTENEGHGGGVYVDNGNFTMSNGDIKNNSTSLGNGGGVYMNRGAITFSNGNISTNHATQGNGGGICLLNGTINITSGTIQSNSCGQYGGGLYVYAESGTGVKKEAAFTGGNIEENSAKYGGGVCVDGNIDLTIGEVTVDKNSATNGGGICLLNGAQMDFGQGFITNNKAQKTADKTSVTACNASITQVSGIGGGIYLDSNTSLTFSVQNELGLYDNLADNAADDIFANGNKTLIDLPSVSSMKLAGFDIAGQPYWVEDYVTGDTEYDEGTKICTTDAYSPLRYRKAVANLQQVYKIESTDALTGAKNKYLCLALGHDVVYVTIRKTGLKKGESSIFTIELVKDNQVDTEKRVVLLTGTDMNGSAVEKKVALSTGKWKVTETPWSWAYQNTEPANANSIEQTVANGSVYEFINVKNTTLLHDEAKVENSMKGVTE